MQLNWDGPLGVADYVTPCVSDSDSGDGFDPGEWGRRIGKINRSTYILPHNEHDSFPDISAYEESLDNSSNEETLRDILSDNEAVLLASCEVNFLALG